MILRYNNLEHSCSGENVKRKRQLQQKSRRVIISNVCYVKTVDETQRQQVQDPLIIIVKTSKHYFRLK